MNWCIVPSDRKILVCLSNHLCKQLTDLNMCCASKLGYTYKTGIIELAGW